MSGSFKVTEPPLINILKDARIRNQNYIDSSNDQGYHKDSRLTQRRTSYEKSVQSIIGARTDYVRQYYYKLKKEEEMNKQLNMEKKLREQQIKRRRLEKLIANNIKYAKQERIHTSHKKIVTSPNKLDNKECKASDQYGTNIKDR